MIEEPSKSKTVKSKEYPEDERMYDEALESGYDRPFDVFKAEILPAIQQPEKLENLRAEFDEYRKSGGLRNFEEFKKLKGE